MFPVLDLHIVEEVPVEEMSVHEVPLLLDSSMHALSQLDPSKSQWRSNSRSVTL